MITQVCALSKMHLEMAVIDPAAAILSAVSVLAPMAGAKKVACETHLEDRDARVIGDDGRLQQIVWNLASNAIKFTPGGGRVDIRARAHEGQYEIAVSDSGRGINPQFLPYIFDRFSQQDSSSSKSFAGLGIGLTIVKHLVEVHQGTIEAASPGEGHGATFLVRIPLTSELAHELPVSSPASRLENMKILVVDDDEDTRTFIARMLSDAGAVVSNAASGDEALAKIEAGTPDLLISDIGMAKQDGYHLIQTLRAAGYTPSSLPAIALTAFSRAQDKTDAINAGFQVHMVKPVEADRLISAIAWLRTASGNPPTSTHH